MGENLEVAATLLLAFDGLEQRLEVAGTKALGAFALDDLEEHGGAVADGLGEDLQQVAVLVAVDEDPELLQLGPRKIEVAEPGAGVVVVGRGHLQETHAAGT